jgi:hypothetical protein
MKLLIKESRRDELAIKNLNKTFSKMYNKTKQIRNGQGKEVFLVNYINGDGIIMVYNPNLNTLSICDDILAPIVWFSYSMDESKLLVKHWFEDKFKLPVKIVHYMEDKEDLS